MPRRYRMTSRKAAVEQTRAAIVKAAKTLHTYQGIQRTSYVEIAQKAGVAQATVYRHFPSLADLIPACAGSIEVLQPITPQEAGELFRGHGYHPPERLAFIVSGTCDCYKREAGWLQAALREGDLLPAVSDAIQQQQRSLKTLVRAALDQADVSDHHVQVLAALLNFPFWKSLRDMGLSSTEATSQVLELAQDYLAKENLIS